MYGSYRKALRPIPYTIANEWHAKLIRLDRICAKYREIIYTSQLNYVKSTEFREQHAESVLVNINVILVLVNIVINISRLMSNL